MSKWIVQRVCPDARSPYHYSWEDVRAPRRKLGGDTCWEANDAAHAFQLAVLENEHERVQSTSYRVLPFTGGATFHVGLNVEASEHDAEQPAAAVEANGHG